MAGISAASFSRYKNGERVPELGTPALRACAAPWGEIAEQRGYGDLTADVVRAAFAACEDFVATDKEQLRRNFNTLVAAMGINLTRLCQYTNYDPSTIFRIRNGEPAACRLPAVCRGPWPPLWPGRSLRPGSWRPWRSCWPARRRI